MKNLEKVRDKRDMEIKKYLKVLAYNRGLSGYRSMDILELKKLLTTVLDRLKLDNIDPTEYKITWYEDNKRVGRIFYIDLEDDSVYSGDY